MLGRFRRRVRRGDAGRARSDPDAGRLRFEVVEDSRSARMALYGEFDIASADDASRALERLLSRDLDAVVIDLSGLDFIDSSGIQFLVNGRDTALARGLKLSLVRGRDPVQRVLTVSGVTALFDGDENRREPGS